MEKDAAKYHHEWKYVEQFQCILLKVGFSPSKKSALFASLKAL